jgi:hypothetical protein
MTQFHIGASIYRLRDLLGWAHRLGISIVCDDQGEFVEYDGVGDGLDPVSARVWEDYVDKEADIIGKTALRQFYARGLGCDNEVRFVRREDPDLGFVASLPLPMVYDGEFYQANGQLLDHDVLENAHQRDLIAHLDAYVVAEQRVH